MRTVMAFARGEAGGKQCTEPRFWRRNALCSFKRKAVFKNTGDKCGDSSCGILCVAVLLVTVTTSMGLHL